MKITFRQGIIRHPTQLTGPDWIQKTSLSGTSVDLNVVQDEPVIITFAHYSANYLFEEAHSVVGAWGSDIVGSVNGPLTASGQTQYLFWDVDLATGQLTRGWTLVPPVVSPEPPVNPAPDTHWFDTTQTRMRVFRQPNPQIAGNWQDKIRVFAAVYDSNSQLIPYQIGTQVGIEGDIWGAGNIILGANNKPLRQSDGTFANTESNLIVYQTSGQNVKFDMALVYAQADEEIPKFSLVSFKPNRRIGLASYLNTNTFISGLIVENLYQDEVGQIITNGVVRNEQWNWTPSQINKPLFCGITGEISLTPPQVGVSQQIGFVYDQDSIYVNLFPPIRLR